MRPSQFAIRLVVFCCIACDASDGGVGLAIGVMIGAAIAVVAVGLEWLLKRDSEPSPR